MCFFIDRLEKEKNALTQEADELAESNEKLQKAKVSSPDLTETDIVLAFTRVASFKLTF